MAASIYSVGSNPDLTHLAQTFRTQINSILTAESEPAKRTVTQRDSVEVRRGVYTDMKTNLDALQTSLRALLSTDSTFTLKSGFKVSVSAGTPGASVATATLNGTTTAADYDLVVQQLAKAQSKASAPVAGTDLALGKTGDIRIGGNGVSDAALDTPTSTLTAVNTASVATAQRELGSGSYTLEMRETSGAKQFRLVDADGKAMSIANTGGTGYTDSWQSFPASGTLDTGRGFSLALSNSGFATTSSFSYTAKGTSITVSSSDTLRTIVANLNAAIQPEGHDFKASIVGKQLVLTGTQTGANHAMIFTDSLSGGGLGFGADLQSAQNAQFTINGMSISRATNTDLADVIDGAKLSLSADAEGKSARVTVGAEYSGAIDAVKTFASKFNDVFTHLTNKMAITSKTEGDKTTYTRGPLAGDTVFRALRLDLLERMNRSYSNSGAFKSLSVLGITFGTDLKVTVDTSKLENAVKNNLSDVSALLDVAMGSLDKTVSRYTGSTGSLQNSLTSMEDQIKRYDTRIEGYNGNLKTREKSLINQYMQMQATLTEMGNTAKMFGIDLGA